MSSVFMTFIKKHLQKKDIPYVADRDRCKGTARASCRQRSGAKLKLRRRLAYR